MKIEDRHVEEALRLAGITDVMLVTWPPAHVLAHALALAKLECAVRALEAERLWHSRRFRVLDDEPREWCDTMHTERMSAISATLTTIRSESHE